MGFIEDLAEKRKKLLDGLDANDGDINLRIFEDFYPDEAHFIFELLQNAEDAGARSVFFDLGLENCSFEHDGVRHFSENDIKSITGIFNSSKKNSPDKIGKFGVGFKSVFVYTETPTVFSKNYSFKILNLVLPESVEPRVNLGEKTRFEFPFNSPKKSPRDAFEEIKNGLDQLSESTLLYLKNINTIGWKCGDNTGQITRHEHSDVHVEVQNTINGLVLNGRHWLRFHAPVVMPGEVVQSERQNVAIAYEMSFLGHAVSFNSSVKLAEQLKIRPAARGRVAVFFPAEKETSGLRFHVHAPFVPELSRASIKNSPENIPLFNQLAKLAAASLHRLKEMGLLSADVLNVLPNNDDSLPDRYVCIRYAVLDEMDQHSLVPTYSGGFAPAKRLFQARSSIKALLTSKDLSFVTGQHDSPEWVMSAPQRNSHHDRFLSSLKIRYWDAVNLKDFLESRALNISNKAEVNSQIISWLSGKSFEWHQALYAILNKYCEDENKNRYGLLGDTLIVRLADGSYAKPSEAYFPAERDDFGDPFPRVDRRILEEGGKIIQQEDARRFLEKTGVKVPGEAEEISLIINSRYSAGRCPESESQHFEDLLLFITYFERNSGQGLTILKDAKIIMVDSSEVKWACSEGVYLDSPFLETGLRFYYELDALKSKTKWPLSARYLDSGIEVGRLLKLFQGIGCTTKFDALYEKARCQDNNEYWDKLFPVPGAMNKEWVNLDFKLNDEVRNSLSRGSANLAILVWNTMFAVGADVLKATYGRTKFGGTRSVPSQLAAELRKLAWLPLSDGRFVSPRYATKVRLFDGFSFGTRLQWLDDIEFGADELQRALESAGRASKRSELGFNSEDDLQRALAFAKLPIDRQRKILSDMAAEKDESFELPVKTLRNSQLRHSRIIEQSVNTPEKISDQRLRSVAIGYDGTKSDAKSYLIDQYTNINNQMICQACRKELPFRLPGGSYYFEAIEIFSDLSKRFREAYLALCPNHAAAFLHANPQRDAMRELILEADGVDLDLVLGEKYTRLYFTETHLADIRACLQSLVELDGGQSDGGEG